MRSLFAQPQLWFCLGGLAGIAAHAWATPGVIVPPAVPCTCPKQTADEYRQELLEAARSVGWACGPVGQP